MNKTDLITALTTQDRLRARSQQTAIGVSQLGGCRTQVWHKLQATPETNHTLSLAAIMGTAIHATIEQALTGNDRYLLEFRIEAQDHLPPATIDCFDIETGTVVDFKTTTKKNLRFFPSVQQTWQVQTYGFLMALAGYEVNAVKLIAIARDGNEKDVIEWSAPYSESVALEALGWLDDVKSMPFAPAPEKDVVFCKDYCGFFGSACFGKVK